MERKAEIRFIVSLDERKFPKQIEWEATEAGSPGLHPCESIMISLWDSDAKDTLGIDLWTDKMLIDDMNIHFHQTFLKMAQTYQMATNNPELAGMISEFADKFAERTNIKH